MNRKIYFFSVVAIVILLLIQILSYSSQSLKSDLAYSNIQTNDYNTQTTNIGYTSLNVIQYRKDGKSEKTVIKLSKTELDNLMKELKKIARSDLDVLEIFEKELQILIDYKIVPGDTKLEDIIDIEQFDNNNYLEFDEVINKPFSAHFAPILVVGGGFGLGIGFRKRLITSFSHLLTLLLGVGYVLCVDFIDSIKYSLICFTLPFLFGYTSGYTGLIIFGIFPGFFYSNLVMIGFAPFTIWTLIPPIEYE